MKKHCVIISILLSVGLLSGCKKDEVLEDPICHKEPKLHLLHFKSEENPYQLISNISSEIIGDSVVECWIPYLVDNKNLVPSISYEGDSLLFNGKSYNMGGVDFERPVLLTICSGNMRADYRVYVHSFTGLPVMWIETEYRKEITSKQDYLNAKLVLKEDVITRGPGDSFKSDVMIKGRGNSTWAYLPKKPYRLKFDEKKSLLGEPADKSWVLLANYADKSMIRNEIAFYLGRLSNLEYTPKFHFVELMLNGRYNGTYQLGDKIKISHNRVNIGDDGFILEVEKRAASEADEVYFYTDSLENPICIKEPEVSFDDEKYNYVRAFVRKAEAALFSEDFTNIATGWQKYIDIDSFVDWYLINEIAKNNDADFVASCYMNFKRGEKLKMGPVWDFDIGFGNVWNGRSDIEGYWVRTSKWYTRLFMDPAFVKKCKERFAFFYSKKTEIMQEINENAIYLRRSAIENNNRWGTLYTETWANYDIWGSYQNEIVRLKEWINGRMEWLKGEFDNM